MASTCVVGLLNLNAGVADRQATPLSSSVVSHRVATERPDAASLLNGASPLNRRQRFNVQLLRLQGQSYCQLNIVPGDLRGLLTTSTRHHTVRLPGRNQIAPDTGFAKLRKRRSSHR